jgi:hypothetical protein
MIQILLTAIVGYDVEWMSTKGKQKEKRLPARVLLPCSLALVTAVAGLPVSKEGGVDQVLSRD